jgi:intracellular multiplication protein IcmO
MKLEDPLETWDFFQKTAGESYVTKVDSFQTNAGSLLNNYMDSRSASTEKRQRVDLLDLKEQREGEAHIFFKSKIIRATMFFANPPPAPRMQLNQFLKVEPPLGRTLIELEDRIARLGEIIASGERLALETEEGEEVQMIVNFMAADTSANPIEKALSALMAFHNRHETAAESSAIALEEEAPAEGRLNIFSKVLLGEDVKQLVGASQFAAFSLPLLIRGVTHDKVEVIERLLGRSASQVGSMANEIIKDITYVTDYPPAVEGILISGDEVVAIAGELCDYVTSLKARFEEGKS